MKGKILIRYNNDSSFADLTISAKTDIAAFCYGVVKVQNYCNYVALP